MTRILRRFRAAAIGAMFAGGCSQGDPVSPPPAPPPPPAGFARWSDPGAWPGGVVPGAGAEVTIAAGRTILLDVSPPALKSLTIEGKLELDRKDLALAVGWIVIRGTLEAGTEAAPFTHRATITLTGPDTDDIQGAGGRVIAVMPGATLDLHGRPRRAWTRLAATAAAGQTQLQLLGPIDWVPGDRIVLASTDFDPFQAEEAVIGAVTGNQVTVQAGLRWSHWGQLQTFAGRSVDERGEVALLTRNLTIQGDSATATATGFGGHIMVMQGATARIEGVELTRMGQKKLLARYPMHWHMAGAVDGQYFRNNSVWKTFNRCLTIHGTRNLRAAGNVCYDNIGHAFFLEDGAETGNVLEDNLGLVTRRPATGEEVLPSDVDPATYWITNPDNSYRRNVAAGSRGFGFWFALPAAPTGLSAGTVAFPRSTPLREFTDNVAHSNRNTGLNVDHGPRPDGTIETVHYAARQTPGNNQTALVTAEFRNFVGYKHTGRAVWLRGSELRLVNATLADNHIGATFASSETFLQDALLVGVTGNAATAFNRGFPVRGYEFYDGRVGAERVTFVNYQPTANNYFSALGYNRSNGFPISTGNFARQLGFVNANPVFLENPLADKDGDKAAVVLDADGSITGTAGQFVAANNPLLLTGACQYRSAWNAHVCAQRFVNLQVRGGQSQAVAPLDLARDDGALGSFVGVPGSPHVVSASVVPSRAYTVSYGGGTVPDRPQLYVNAIAQGEYLRITLPYPRATVKVYRDYNTTTAIPAAGSVAELDAGAGDKYFLDPVAGRLHLKLVPRAGRDWATLFAAP